VFQNINTQNSDVGESLKRKNTVSYTYWWAPPTCFNTQLSSSGSPPYNY